MTALATAFAKKGVDRNEVEFSIAVAKFLNNGGTIERAHTVIDAAERRGGGGQTCGATPGQIVSADASPPNDGEEGRTMFAGKAAGSLPSSPSRQAGPGEGRTGDVGETRTALPSPSPRPMPGHAKRGLSAIASVQPTIAKSLFDSHVLPDGRRLREVRWSECPTLATRYRRHAYVLLAVHNHAIPPNPSATLDVIVNEGQLKSFIADAEKINAI